MPDIFISYSRKHVDFVTRLYEQLRQYDLDVWVDLEEIPISADWWHEIAQGIEACDTFVFVLTPESIESIICQLEVAHALEHGKRIIPILRAEVDRDLSIARLSGKKLDEISRRILGSRDLLHLATNNWTEVSRHNYLMALDTEAIEKVTEKLVDAHKTDLNYVREHTQLMGRALRWERHKKQSAFLLSGAELKEADNWLANSGDCQPPVTAKHREFITQSHRYTARKLRVNSAAFLIAVTLSLAIGAFIVFTLLNTIHNRILGGSQLNIAVVDIGEKNAADDAVQASDQTENLSAYVFNQLSNGMTVDNTEGALLVDIDRGVLSHIEEEGPENQRLAQIKQLAEDMHADVVVHGYVDLTQGGQITYVPEFYISPRLFDADDSVGLHFFGSPVPVDDLTVVEPLRLEDTLLPRIKALRHFLTGLRYVRIDRTDRALEQFDLALMIPNAWPEDADSGRALIHMWIGTAYERNYLNKLPSDGLECPVDPDAVEVNEAQLSGNRVLDCALIAYQYALALDDNLVRAYIGLGNIYVDRLEAAVQSVGYSPEDCENATEVAVSHYQTAIELTQNAEDAQYINPLLILKANFDIGIAYRDASQASCHLFVNPDESTLYQVPSRQYFDKVLILYPPVAAEAGAVQLYAQALYERARMDANLGDFDAARRGIQETIAITTETNSENEQEWQWLRWKAHTLNAALYRAEALNSDGSTAQTKWEECLGQAEEVLNRLNQPGRYDDVETIYRAYFFAGQAEEALGNKREALAHYNNALAIGEEGFVFYNEIIDRIAAINGT